MNYERDMFIDDSALDVEWLEQSTLATKWGMYYNDCKEEFTRSEENVKVVQAELNALVNEDPETHLGEGIKPTVANVDAFIRTHDNYKEAKERWIKAMRAMNDAEVIKNEISFTRKAALENLVQLHGQQYFAGPRVPRNLHDEREKRKSVQSRVRTYKKD
jgi:hypothetical protein